MEIRRLPHVRLGEEWIGVRTLQVSGGPGWHGAAGVGPANRLVLPKCPWAEKPYRCLRSTKPPEPDHELPRRMPRRATRPHTEWPYGWTQWTIDDYLRKHRRPIA